jgi:uncharacterized protein (TIGR00369 family)
MPENFNALLGIRLVRRHSDGVTVDCPLRPDLMNFAGIVHGGVVASLADVAVGQAIGDHFNRKRRATTVEMKISFLRPVSGRLLVARAKLLRVGNHLCVGQVDLFDDSGKQCGAALVTYMLLEGEPEYNTALPAIRRAARSAKASGASSKR